MYLLGDGSRYFFDNVYVIDIEFDEVAVNKNR